MQLTHPSTHTIAFIRPEEGANAGLVRTASGTVVVDTTFSPHEMATLLGAAEEDPAGVSLVINTHFHSDHTWGNQLFDCPILSQRLCRERMEQNLAASWSAQAIAEWITEVEKSDPAMAAGIRVEMAELHITLPTEVFEDRFNLLLGGVRLETIHMGGHTPGSAVVWLPDEGVLFAGDLIFARCYPYAGDADVPAYIDALKQLPAFGAQYIVPGHGEPCGEAEIQAQVDYLEETWARTAEHVAQGHDEEEAVADPGYPRPWEAGAERMHGMNIRRMYGLLMERAT